MEPGRELDKLVAEAMGWPEKSPFYTLGELKQEPNLPRFSTDWATAGPTWVWLEQNHPWEEARLSLERLWALSEELRPCVVIWRNRDDPGIYFIKPWSYDSDINRIRNTTDNFAIFGQTYPHAISLAVVEAAKVKETLT